MSQHGLPLDLNRLARPTQRRPLQQTLHSHCDVQCRRRWRPQRHPARPGCRQILAHAWAAWPAGTLAKEICRRKGSEPSKARRGQARRGAARPDYFLRALAGALSAAGRFRPCVPTDETDPARAAAQRRRRSARAARKSGGGGCAGGLLSQGRSRSCGRRG